MNSDTDMNKQFFLENDIAENNKIGFSGRRKTWKTAGPNNWTPPCWCEKLLLWF